MNYLGVVPLVIKVLISNRETELQSPSNSLNLNFGVAIIFVPYSVLHHVQAEPNPLNRPHRLVPYPVAYA